ncbi:MAG TPA: hypothetical protein VJ826_03860, partial [Candidatus Polarisedimenticolaceae bacterium]|nr:hypothetical protein [Candidatus Polarisedimenticolaceae bacterium]
MLGIARIAAALGLILAVGAETRASCVTDAGEPDDQCVAAAAVVLGGSSQPRNFCDDATDWVTFNGCPGRGYTVETSGLGVAADTVLELYDRDCSTLLATDDDGAGG